MRLYKSGGIQSSILQRCCYFAVVALLYAIAASQTVASFSYKWTTIADHPQYSLQNVISFDAPRPYAYRILTPFIVRTVTDALPEMMTVPLYDRAHMALNNILDEGSVAALPEQVIVAYGVTITLNFVAMMGILWMLRALAQQTLGHLGLLRDIGPILFALMLTISYRTTNGFIYDFVELLLFVAYLLLWRHIVAAAFIVVLAVLNKETAIFFPMIVAAGAWGAGQLRSYSKSLLMAIACAAVTFLVVRLWLAGTPGTHTEFHFYHNLEFWLSWLPWVSVTTPHMSLIALPKPTNIILLVLLLVMIGAYWRMKPLALRVMLVTAVAILSPLFLLFCWQDEFRNFSLSFPFLHLAAMQTIATYMQCKEERSTICES